MAHVLVVDKYSFFKYRLNGNIWSAVNVMKQFRFGRAGARFKTIVKCTRFNLKSEIKKRTNEMLRGKLFVWINKNEVVNSLGGKCERGKRVIKWFKRIKRKTNGLFNFFRVRMYRKRDFNSKFNFVYFSLDSECRIRMHRSSSQKRSLSFNDSLQLTSS